MEAWRAEWYKLMPMYEYKCERGHVFEQIQKFSDAPIEICPIPVGENAKCGTKSKRVMAVSNFALKGAGWYRDGYIKKEPHPREQARAPSDTNFREVAEKTRKSALKRDFGINE